VKNGEETDVDCGGPAADCRRCDPDEGCAHPHDCSSKVCIGGVCKQATCTDGVTNGEETDLDCGGNCPDCPNGSMCQEPGDCQSQVCEGGFCGADPCENGVTDGSETDTDCGGPDCPPCKTGDDCGCNDDCEGGVCCTTASNAAEVRTCGDASTPTCQLTPCEP